jgi:hypothetical protein
VAIVMLGHPSMHRAKIRSVAQYIGSAKLRAAGDAGTSEKMTPTGYRAERARVD